MLKVQQLPLSCSHQQQQEMATLDMKDNRNSSEDDFDPSDLDSEITDGEIDDLSDLGDDDLSTDLFDEVEPCAFGVDRGPNGEASNLKKQSLLVGVESSATPVKHDYRAGLSRNLFENLKSNRITAQIGMNDTDETGSVASKKRRLEETFNFYQKKSTKKKDDIRRHSIHNTDIGTHQTVSQSLIDPQPFSFNDGDETGVQYRDGKRVASDVPVRASSVGALDQSFLAGIDFSQLGDGSSDSECEDSDDESTHNNFILSNWFQKIQKSPFVAGSENLSGHGNSDQANISQQQQEQQNQFPNQFFDQSQATSQQEPFNSAVRMDTSSATGGNSVLNHDATNQYPGEKVSSFNSPNISSFNETSTSTMQAHFNMPPLSISMQPQISPDSAKDSQPDFFATASSNATSDQQQSHGFDPQLQITPVDAPPVSMSSPDAFKIHQEPQTDQHGKLPSIAEPAELGEDPPIEIDHGAMMCKLSSLMTRSMETQKSLQEWDKRNGLPRSHSQTMVKSNRSRRQLQEGVILKKWDGSPLISFDEDGKVKETDCKKPKKKNKKKHSSKGKDCKRDSGSLASKDSSDELDPLSLY
uniref:Uncharacterized protein n=1 Tax=Ditylum brightwellii TaxID=49249 RepID=A0A7S4TBI0_9STRA